MNRQTTAAPRVGGGLRRRAVRWALALVALRSAACGSPPAPEHASSTQPTTKRSEYAAIDVPDPAAQDAGEVQEAEEAPPAAAPPVAETLATTADCTRWRSERGRRPREPAPQCAGPALDPYSTTHDRQALSEVERAIAWTDSVPPMNEMIATLLGVSDACNDQCSPKVQSKLWMYTGIVFGSGRQDLVGAQCAFEVALAWDPKVRLDKELSTDDTKAAFATARREVCGK